MLKALLDIGGEKCRLNSQFNDLSNGIIIACH